MTSIDEDFPLRIKSLLDSLRHEFDTMNFDDRKALLKEITSFFIWGKSQLPGNFPLFVLMQNDGVIGCLSDEKEAKEFCDAGNELNFFVTPYIYYHYEKVIQNKIPQYAHVTPTFHKFELERAIRENEGKTDEHSIYELKRAKQALARKLYIDFRDLCPKCEGKGRIYSLNNKSRKCSHCNGGYVPLQNDQPGEYLPKTDGDLGEL